MRLAIRYIIAIIIIILMIILIYSTFNSRNLADKLCKDKSLDYISNTDSYYTCADSDGITRTFKYKEGTKDG